MDNIVLRTLRITTKYRQIKKIFDYDSHEKQDMERCPGCSGKKEECLRNFGYVDRYGFGAKTSWCVQCGLIFINPRMTIETYNKFYESGAYRNIIRIFSGKKAKSGKVKYNQNAIPKRVKPIQDVFKIYFDSRRNLRVLDIGGTKKIFEFMKTQLDIKKYFCINPAPSEIEIEADRMFSFYRGTIEEFDSREEKYDLICLFGTLNHLLEPMTVFNKISSLLDKDGIFIFDHVNRVSKMALAEHPFQQIQIDHPIYPGKETVIWLLHQAGLDVDNVYSSLPSVDFYVTKKMSKPCSLKIDDSALDNIEKLSCRMRSTRPKFLIRLIVRKYFHK